MLDKDAIKVIAASFIFGLILGAVCKKSLSKH